MSLICCLQSHTNAVRATSLMCLLSMPLAQNKINTCIHFKVLHNVCGSTVGHLEVQGRTPMKPLPNYLNTKCCTQPSLSMGSLLQNNSKP